MLIKFLYNLAAIIAGVAYAFLLVYVIKSGFFNEKMIFFFIIILFIMPLISMLIIKLMPGEYLLLFYLSCAVSFFVILNHQILILWS